VVCFTRQFDARRHRFAENVPSGAPLRLEHFRFFLVSEMFYPFVFLQFRAESRVTPFRELL